MIKISCKRKKGIWRGGVFHPAEVVEHKDEAFTDDQLALIKAENLLFVEKIEDADKPLTAKEIAALMAQAETLEQLEALVPEGDMGKMIKAAYEKRKAELEQPPAA